MVDEKVGRQVRAIREAQGLSGEQVADCLGMSVDDYRDLECGLKRFSAVKLRELSSLMKVNVAAFFNTIGVDGPSNERIEADFGRFAK